MERIFSSLLRSPNSEVVWPTIKPMDQLFKRGSDQSYVGHDAGGSHIILVMREAYLFWVTCLIAMLLDRKSHLDLNLIWGLQYRWRKFLIMWRAGMVKWAGPDTSVMFLLRVVDTTFNTKAEIAPIVHELNWYYALPDTFQSGSKEIQASRDRKPNTKYVHCHAWLNANIHLPAWALTEPCGGSVA